MAALQHRHFAASIASLYFQHQNPSKKNMPSPISPTYSSSAPSPFSSASSASFPNENSPISETHFDNIPSPVDAVNTDVAVYPSGPVSVQMFASQCDTAPSYAADLDYGMMTLASDLKKSQVPFLLSLPPSLLFSPSRYPRQQILRPQNVPFPKTMSTVYIPPPAPPQRHNQATLSSVVRLSIPFQYAPSPHRHQHQRQTQPHHLHAQQSLAPPQVTANDVMFDVDLDDWNTSPTGINPHGHSR